MDLGSQNKGLTLTCMGLFDGHRHREEPAGITIIEETDIIIYAGDYYRKHNPDDLKELDLLHKILHKLNQIQMTQAELAQALRDAAAEAVKAKAEIVSKIADLEAAIASAGNTTQEVDDALQALKDSVQGVDDIVPDAPPA